MQARHFRIHLGSPHLPGHFISSLGRVMHVPKLCKMHNQAFKYTPCEWPMCMHVHVHVHTYCTCGVYYIDAQSYTHTHTKNAYYSKTSRYYSYVLLHIYTNRLYYNKASFSIPTSCIVTVTCVM